MLIEKEMFNEIRLFDETYYIAYKPRFRIKLKYPFITDSFVSSARSVRGSQNLMP